MLPRTLLRLIPLAAALASIPLAACGGSPPPAPATPPADSAAASSPAPVDSTSAATAPAASSSASAAASAPSTPPPAGMVEYDLSTVDPKWKGWVIDGPPNAKVMLEGVTDARLAQAGQGMMASGPPVDTLDISLKLEKASLDDEKAQLKSLKPHPSPGVTRKVTVITDTPDKLEWTDVYTRKGQVHTEYHFVMNFQASGQDATCRTLQLGMGAVSKDGLAQFEASCATLHKK
jgi:hypothetical protein